MNVAWLGGWGISANLLKAEAVKQFPNHSHHVICPEPNWEVDLPDECDLFIGYSLGALLLACCGEEHITNNPIVLLAPFVDFKKESGSGGRVSVVQLKLLKKMIKADPKGALNDFYARAGLNYKCASELPYSEESLTWGIDQLINLSADAEVFSKAKEVIIGAKDPLIDAGAVPYKSATKLIPDAGHQFELLIPHISVL